MRKSLLLALLLLFAGVVSKGQNILSENFENGFLPSGWTSATSNASYPWSGPAAAVGNPAPAAHSATHYAWYNSYNASTGSNADLITSVVSFSYASGSNTVSFWMYRDGGYSTSADRVETYVNTSAGMTGATLLGTINRSTSLSPTVSATGWYQYTFTVPSSFNSSTNYIIFHAVSAYGNDIYLDDVSIDHLPLCSGTISGGTASASPSPVCANASITLTDVGYTAGSGMTYQWQSSPSGANTWSNITGATTPVYTLSAGITSATDFRFQATCTNTSSTGTSNTASVTMNSYLNCYCTPTTVYGCIYQDDIHVFTLTGSAGTSINQTTPCPTGNNLGYTNYSSLTPVKMVQGATYSGTINTDYPSSEYAAIWVDFNNDGTFATSERIWTSPGTIATYTATTAISMTIPTTAPIGNHRMRVRLVYAVISTSIPPCSTGSEYYGEARDYTITILSQTPPPPVVTNNSPICPGSNLVITAVDTGGYPSPTFTLTGPGITSPLTSSSGIFTLPNTTAGYGGTWSVTTSSGGFTSAPGTTVVTMYPVANLAAGTIVSTSTCLSSDGSFQLTGLPPSATFTLTYNNPAGAPISKTITSTASGTYTESSVKSGTYTNIKVTNIGSGGCTSNTISLTIPPPGAPPTPIVAYQQPLCPGTTLQLSVTNVLAGGTYQWTTTAGTWNNPTPGTGSTASRTNMTSTQNGNYCAIVTDNNGCVSAPGCVAVTVNAKDPKPAGPGIAPNNPLQYCQGEVTLPLTASGTNLTWFGPYNYPAPCSGPDSSKIPRAQIYPRTDCPGNWVYGAVQYVTCPSDTAYVIVTVKPKPGKPIVPPNAIEYCQFSPASPLSASGANIRWFSTPTGGTGTATAPTPGTLVPGTYFYYVSQTVNGCESDRAVITVNVKPKPAPPVVTSPLNLCQGDPVGPLTAIGQNLLWYTAASGGVGVPVAPIPNTGYEDSFKYWVSQTVNGCESDRALIQAYVNYKPNGIIVGTSQWVCQDAEDTFYYYGNARSDAQYIWFSPYPQTRAVSGKDTRGPFVVHFDSAGTAVIRLQINNKGCISTLIAAPITVRHLPVIDFSLKRDVCKDELVNIALTATEPGISDFMFNFGNTTDTTMVYSAPPGGPFGIRYHTPGDYVVSATATLNQCTSKPLEKRITVHDLPDAHISVADNHDLSQPVCASDTITFSVKQVSEGAIYTWTPAAYFQSLRDTLNYIVRAVVSQTSVVKVHITTAYGCEGTDSIAVTTKPCCGVYFPTAFAPEGNVNQNRIFRPITIGFHQINNFRVVNRWGQVMYETKNERSGWDGTYNGVKQDMGVYYWYISYKCEGKTMEEHGEVTLMR
jgi:gliding motility-associated-like protein